MAYTRRAVRRRATARRSSVRARKGRGGYSKRVRRPVARQRTVRRLTSRRRILNITTRKKRDHMIPCAKPDPYANPTDPQLGGVLLNKANGNRFWYGFQATCRDNTNIPGVGGGIFDDGSRTASRCFMVGLKERCLLQSSGNMSFMWRRIVFSFKGQEIVSDPVDGTAAMYLELNPQGYTRAVTVIQNGTPPVPGSNPVQAALENIMFRGVRGIDWFDEMDAQVDNNRVKLLYDKRRSINSGNDTGLIRRFNFWHPFRKTLLYNDDENAGGKNASAYSVNNEQSMGDVYVIDLFALNDADPNGMVIEYRPEATLYWHEH